MLFKSIHVNLIVLILLTGCSSSEEESPAALSDISKAAYSQTLHPLLVANCAQCHSENSVDPEEPYIAEEDIAKSFSRITPFVSLDEPLDSTIVTKILDNHFCWTVCESDARVLGDSITIWSNTADSTVSLDKDASLMAGFGQELWPLLQENCSNCHDGLLPTAPNFASNNLDEAYNGISSSSAINFETPITSRLVERMQLGHNCGDEVACTALADAFVDIIDRWNAGYIEYGSAASKSAFNNTFYNWVVDNCSQCHSGEPEEEGGIAPIAFAHPSLDLAYKIMITNDLIDANDPARSFIVNYVGVERHQCPNGDDNCESDAKAMEQEIKAWLADDDIIGDQKDI
ncbi:MAG: hypothetical protein AAGB12_08250 [Pseudomonadota bacterium]